MDYIKWKHVFKLDPAKDISDEHLELICESGTDAIIVGGTDNVTLDGVLDLLVRIRRYTVDVALEVSSADSLTPGYDFYFIPTVLNSQQAAWIVGAQMQAIKEYGDFMRWEEIAPEGYVILNGDCKAAKLTNAQTDLAIEDVIAYARLAENYFKLPIFYMEYSGTYGDVSFVQQVKEVLSETKLFYGGGIETYEQAKEMAAFADTIVVGNSIYTNLEQALATVKAVK